jgi:hypothetical protein
LFLGLKAYAVGMQALWIQLRTHILMRSCHLTCDSLLCASADPVMWRAVASA